jgi:hypothetical protein
MSPLIIPLHLAQPSPSPPEIVVTDADLLREDTKANEVCSLVSAKELAFGRVEAQTQVSEFVSDNCFGFG